MDEWFGIIFPDQRVRSVFCFNSCTDGNVIKSKLLASAGPEKAETNFTHRHVINAPFWLKQNSFTMGYRTIVHTDKDDFSCRFLEPTILLRQ
jgi:hypothetical protein